MRFPIQICLCVFMFLVASNSLVSGQCLSKHKQLLVQLRKSLTYDSSPSSKLSTWDESKDCCTWSGVSCDKSGGVIGLDVSSCGLGGVVPTELFQISTLQTLDLSNNRELLGSLPEFSSGAGSSLQNLDLSFTKFAGKLPNSIGNLSKLSRLGLFGCNFSGPIPSSMSKLSRLVFVDLSVNHFTGYIPVLSLSRNLSTLLLRGNNLVGKIPSFLFSHPKLQLLDLSDNRLSGPINELKSAPLSPLESLELSGNNLNGPLPEFLFKITTLSGLSLAGNQFSGNVELTKFAGLKNLVDLDLSHNKLSVQTSGSEAAFASLPPLNSLMLSSCQIKKFPSLRNQTRLNMIDLSENQIIGEIPNYLWGLHSGSLPFVNLSYNQFTKLQEPYQFQFHQYLDLHSNKLAGAFPLPPRSGVFIDFSDNKFTSPIPADIGNHLISAISFKLSRNNIVGEIPASICSPSALKTLDLCENSLSGSIPSCLIEKSKTLELLNLHGNKLSGSIPDKFPEGCSLETLDLSFNLLEGKVPKSLDKCKELKVLNLDHNKIHH